MFFILTYFVHTRGVDGRNNKSSYKWVDQSD
jgi:hypothetical protein